MNKLGFKESIKNVKVPLVDDSFTNAICYGRTGSGKTTAFILPNIENRIKKGHGILVYDFKGNMHKHVKYIANSLGKLQDVYEIGKPWGENIDLLKDSNTTIITSMLDTVNSHGTNDYWRNASNNLLSNIYNLLKNSHMMYEIIFNLQEVRKLQIVIAQSKLNLELSDVLAPNIKNIFSCVKSIKHLTEFLDMQKDIIETTNKFITIMTKHKQLSMYMPFVRKISMYHNNVFKYYDNLAEYHGVTNNPDEVSGKFGVLGVLSSLLSIAASKDYLSNDKFDVLQALMKGKIVILNVANLDSSLITLFNINIYRRLQNKIFYSDACPVTIFMDEAQKVLSENHLPEVDICRECGFEYIFSTQDELLLENKLGPHKAKEMLRNVATQYSFTTNMNESINDTHKLNSFEYCDLNTHRTYYAKPLFFSDEDLFDTEFEFQKQRDILEKTSYKSEEKFILRYQSDLEESSEAYIEFKNKKSLQKVYIDVETVSYAKKETKSTKKISDNKQMTKDEFQIGILKATVDKNSEYIRSLVTYHTNLGKRLDMLELKIKSLDESKEATNNVLR